MEEGGINVSTRCGMLAYKKVDFLGKDEHYCVYVKATYRQSCYGIHPIENLPTIDGVTFDFLAFAAEDCGITDDRKIGWKLGVGVW